MPTDKYGQGVTYPPRTDPPDAEIIGEQIVDGLMPFGVMRFDSASGRTANLTGGQAPVDGMATYLGAEERFEGRAGGAWVALTPGPWIPIPFASGYEAQSGSPAYRIWGDKVELRGAVTRTSGHFVKGVVTLFATLPAGFRPSGTCYLPAAVGSTTAPGGRCDVFTNGQLNYLVPTAATNDVDTFSLASLSFSTA